jgi:hypothetical protein
MLPGKAGKRPDSPAGVYFCKMQATCRSASTAGDYHVTQKLVLQR